MNSWRDFEDLFTAIDSLNLKPTPESNCQRPHASFAMQCNAFHFDCLHLTAQARLMMKYFRRSNAPSQQLHSQLAVTGGFSILHTVRNSPAVAVKLQRRRLLMTEYHTQYQRPEGESTQWEDIHRKLGNFAPAEPIWKPEPFSPTQETAKDQAWLDQQEDPGTLEDAEDEFADDSFLDQYRKQRLKELQQQSAKRKFGEIFHINKEQFVTEVTKASDATWVVVVLYNDKYACDATSTGIKVLHSSGHMSGPHYVRSQALHAIAVSDCLPQHALTLKSSRSFLQIAYPTTLIRTCQPFCCIKMARSSSTLLVWQPLAAGEPHLQVTAQHTCWLPVAISAVNLLVLQQAFCHKGTIV
ncbi:hypothetical protein MMC29_001311 [Sticta canariensis]|nr:hypothetical protein [Sticta canariensis]